MLVTAPTGHPPLDLPGPCLVPAWPDPLAPGPHPVRIDWIPFPSSQSSGLFLALARVSAGRTGCPCLRSALGSPPQEPTPTIHGDVFAPRVTRLGARVYLLGGGKAVALRLPVTSGPARSVPPPPSRVLGPSTLYGRPRSKSVVAVRSRSLCNTILVARFPSPPDLSGHRRTLPFAPC